MKKYPSYFSTSIRGKSFFEGNNLPILRRSEEKR